MSKILIIDDSITSRKILKTVLEENGHEVVGEASNGENGFEKYCALKPDLTTLDITMPVLDGISALEKIIAFDENAKVIMVTASGQKGKIVEAIKVGASDFIQKPYEASQIISVINATLNE